MPNVNDISLIALLSFLTILPFLMAGGTCFIKFSIVLSMVRNALGLQQVPSTLTLNGIAMILTFVVMAPVVMNISDYITENHTNFNNAASVHEFLDHGFDSYRNYLVRYSNKNLIKFFYDVQQHNVGNTVQDPSLDGAELNSLPFTVLLPSYALSEIESAFKISFYIYIPFVVIDLIVSSILLALGMMMMSPVTISTPIKLILFVSMHGWSLLAHGLIMQYIQLAKT